MGGLLQSHLRPSRPVGVKQSRSTSRSRTYRAEVDGRRYFCKVAAGSSTPLLEEFRVVESVGAAFMPKPVICFPDEKVAVYEWIEGEVPRDLSRALLHGITIISKAIHEIEPPSGLPRIAGFDFLLRNQQVLLEGCRQLRFPNTEWLDLVERIVECHRVSELPLDGNRLIHHDPSRDNWIVNGSRVSLVDWEQTATGDFAVYLAGLFFQWTFDDRIRRLLSVSDRKRILSEFPKDTFRERKIEAVMQSQYIDAMIWYLQKWDFLHSLPEMPKGEPVLTTLRFQRALWHYRAVATNAGKSEKRWWFQR